MTRDVLKIQAGDLFGIDPATILLERYDADFDEFVDLDDCNISNGDKIKLCVQVQESNNTDHETDHEPTNSSKPIKAIKPVCIYYVLCIYLCIDKLIQY